jgi:dethiobiotin synthetase
MRTNGFFVAGTDTGVGKTELACGLLRAFAARGLRAVGMKPVAAGARRIGAQLRSADVRALERAANTRAPRRLINPYVFAAPVAPHIAADRDGVDIRFSEIERAYRLLAARVDLVVVEGVGGLLVPLDDAHDTADIVQRLRLPVVLVVGMRLGCLSHAALTATAIAARGLELAGWIANRIDPHMREYRANVAALESRLAAPLIAQVAYRSRPSERAQAIDLALARSAHLDACIGQLRAPARRAYGA